MIVCLSMPPSSTCPQPPGLGRRNIEEGAFQGQSLPALEWAFFARKERSFQRRAGSVGTDILQPGRQKCSSNHNPRNRSTTHATKTFELQPFLLGKFVFSESPPAMSEAAEADWPSPFSPISEPGDELGGAKSAEGNEPGGGQGASSARAGPLLEDGCEEPFGSFLAANIPGEKQGLRSPSPLPEGEGEEPFMGRNA